MGNAALDGIRADAGEEYEMLKEVFESNAFELQIRPGTEGVYDVPYMLNDGLECYLVFTGARLQGKFLDGMEEDTTGSLLEEDGRKGLIIRQGQKNVCTLWFTELHTELGLYCFHEIGHFWEDGAEQWRRLVYIIGTMEDKYLFMGEEVCNPQEISLIPLMQFTPFCRYYPAKVCIPEEYVMTEEGCMTMLSLAEEAGDRTYAALIRLYLKFPCACLERLLHRSLMGVKQGKLYDLIVRKAAEASGQYPARDYGMERNQILEARRRELDRQFLAHGYRGSYPDYQKEKVHVQVAEEHPFTRMEVFEEGLHFHLMVSEQPENMDGSNRGFFRGRHLRGSICSPEELFAHK